jgi:hypothetical protein
MLAGKVKIDPGPLNVGGEGAVVRAQEAVLHSARVKVRSRDRSRRVNARGESEGRARTIERCECAFSRAQEAVRITPFKDR